MVETANASARDKTSLPIVAIGGAATAPGVQIQPGRADALFAHLAFPSETARPAPPWYIRAGAGGRLLVDDSVPDTTPPWL